MDEIKLRDQILEIVDAIVDRTMQMDLTWDWGTGVAYYGICSAYQATGKKVYFERLQQRIDELISLGLKEKWTVNTCAMGHCLITLFEETGDQKYWQLVLGKIDYLQNHALRFGEGILQHTVSSGDDFPEQAWADTLFMAAFFMLRVGVKLQDQKLIEDALNQFYWHIHFLQDDATGLFYHGYSHITKDHLSGFFWGRANAWAAFTMAKVSEYLPQAYLYPTFMDILGSLDEQLSSLRRRQTPEGLWRTILDDPTSYEEVSASAGIAAAMVVHGNPLHQKTVENAYKGVINQITSDGRVLNVSAGTAVMNDANGYRKITKNWLQGWGQGLTLAFLTEIFQRAV